MGCGESCFFVCLWYTRVFFSSFKRNTSVVRMQGTNCYYLEIQLDLFYSSTRVSRLNVYQVRSRLNVYLVCSIMWTACPLNQHACSKCRKPLRNASTLLEGRSPCPLSRGNSCTTRGALSSPAGLFFPARTLCRLPRMDILSFNHLLSDNLQRLFQSRHPHFRGWLV